MKDFFPAVCTVIRVIMFYVQMAMRILIVAQNLTGVSSENNREDE